jgi:predicted  nucleic acid-binding Zn-ribbon protein
MMLRERQALGAEMTYPEWDVANQERERPDPHEEHMSELPLDTAFFRPEFEDIRVKLERALAAGEELQSRVVALSRALQANAAHGQRVTELSRELSAAERRIEALQSECAGLARAKRELEERLSASLGTIQRLRQSLSWKVTVPLRFLLRPFGWFLARVRQRRR